MDGKIAFDLAVFDVFGKKVFEQTACTSSCLLDLSSLGIGRGIYFLEWRSGNVVGRGKCFFAR
jgi:hypothetical protein